MKVTRLVSAVLLTRELRKKINWINEVMILKKRKDNKKKIPSWHWIYLVVPKVMLMTGDHFFFLWRFMSRPHHENRNIGIYCKNVIELRRHWQHLKKIFKYSGNHHDFLFLFSYVKKGNIGRRLTCSCTFHLFPLLSLINYLKITMDVLLYNKVRDWFCHTIYVASHVLIVFEEPNQI